MHYDAGIHLNREFLLRILDYDNETGLFVWRKRTEDYFKDTHRYPAVRNMKIWNTRFGGQEASCAHSAGYRVIRILGKGLFAHRLAWIIENNHLPEQIDHINGIRDDNRIVNLRAANPKINGRNTAIGSANTSGHIGVSFHKASGKWRSRIKVDGIELYLGIFSNKNDAINAREEADIRYTFHKNHGRSPTIA